MRMGTPVGPRVILAGLALVLAMAGAGTAQARPAAQAAQAVSIVDFAFNPATLTVPVGTRVTWTNTGNAPHTATADAGAWDSGRLTTGGSFAFTFNTAGTFAYHCAVHPRMTASIVVQARAAAAAPAPAAQATATAARAPAAAPAAAAQPRPATPTMPRTGAGLASEHATRAWWAVLAAVAALAAAGAVAARARSRTR